MSFRPFIDLGLYRSFCILLASLFFVSCNTVSNKPTEIVSAAGSRKIASAALANINASTFLVMQNCPILANIQSMSRSGYYTNEQIMIMMSEQNTHGQTLTQMLMKELTSSTDCLSRIAELRESICTHDAHLEICDTLDKLEKINARDFLQEFEEFAGASVESISPDQLAVKIQEYIISNHTLLGKIYNAAQNPYVMLSAIIIAVAVIPLGAGVLGATAAVGIAKATVTTLGTGAVASLLPGIVTVSGLITYNRIRNLRNRK